MLKKCFSKQATTKQRKPLEFIHTDIRKLIHIRINIFLIFIDDFIRKTCVHFVNKKSEVFSIFKKFKDNEIQ